MVFSSSLFLFFFLPCVLSGCLLLKNKYINYFLLIMSLLFYTWGEPKFVWVFLASMAVNYAFGMLFYIFRAKPSWKKCSLILSIVFNLGILFCYKYLGLVLNTLNLSSIFPAHLSNIILPIGISFYTFQAMSYLFDVYNGTAVVQKNPFKLALYISLFPQLIAGPIVRYVDVADEINKRTITCEDICTGIRRFVVGLAKKVLISNSVALYADMAFSLTTNELSLGGAWLGIVCYTLQIYFDFSGYSDMAIGLGKMLGFHFMENFNLPYQAASIQEFWRKWHISLSSWFRDYLYIPLGGNRKGLLRTVVNQLIVFSLCGLWHGAEWTFLLWGVYHGIFLLFEKIPQIKRVMLKFPIPIRHTYTMMVIMIGWVFFRADNMAHAIDYLKAMIGSCGNSGLLGDRVSLSLTMTSCALGILFALVKIPVQYSPIKENGRSNKRILIQDTAILILFIICVIRIVPNNYNPFIYFRF